LLVLQQIYNRNLLASQTFRCYPGAIQRKGKALFSYSNYYLKYAEQYVIALKGQQFCSSSQPYLQNEDPIDFASADNKQSI